MSEILVTGANRGIGLEFVRQHAAAGHRVQATCRNPDSASELQALSEEFSGLVVMHQLDVTDADAVHDLMKRLDRDEPGRIDRLINNAGVQPRGEELINLDPDDMLAVYRINSIAPMIVLRHALPLLFQAEAPIVVNISSAMGSLTEKDYGRHYSYASSKAALNMLTRAAAHDVRGSGITVVAMHPGWVRTDMGTDKAPVSPTESVAGMMRVIEKLTLEDSGSFLTHEGEIHPW